MTANRGNSHAAHSDKKGHKKNRTGCHTFTAYGDYISIM
jgi:hypothetical protein